MHSVTTLSIDFDRTCSSRFGNELNVESVPLNPWMKTMSSKSGGNGLINAPEFPSSAPALDEVLEEVVDELAIVWPARVVVVPEASEKRSEGV